MNLELTTPAIVTLAIGGLMLVATIIGSVVTREMPSLRESGISSLIALVILPYTVNCLVVGECHWYAWLLVIAVTVPTLKGVIGLVRAKKPTEK